MEDLNNYIYIYIIMDNKKIKNNNKLNNKNNNILGIDRKIFIISIILLIFIIYWIYNICYDYKGEYRYIGKNFFERIKEILSGKYRINIEK